MITNETTTPRVYVSTFAKYASGSLRGEWIELEGHDADTFEEAARALHADESDPELLLQDFEGFPKEFYNESGLATGLWEWLELSEDDQELLALYHDAVGAGTLREAQDAFAGNAESGADFAQRSAEESGAIPTNLPSWIVIDWDSTWKRNLRHDYNYTFDPEGKWWFFHA